MIIMKFGGTSLANAERIRHVGNIVENNREKNPILVLSAMGTTTDDLLEAGQQALVGEVSCAKIRHTHEEALRDLGLPDSGTEELLVELINLLRGISLIKELTPRTKDHLTSFGERLSTRIFSAYLNERGIKAQQMDGWAAGVVTNSNFNRAEPLPEIYETIAIRLNSLEKGSIPVITGFIGKDCTGAITTLGRGGSDLTAALVGAALNVREIQVWKDVHGILSSDPRIIKSAIPVPAISFEEAAELAYFGAKVLHPRSILPAMKKGIPVRVKNSYDPSHPGTLIVSEVIHNVGWVTAITYKKGQAMVHICSTRMLGQSGFLAKVFQIFADLKISVDVIATSEVSISLTLDNQEGLLDLEKRLGEIATVRIDQNITIISLIGNTEKSSEILERSLKTLSQKRVAIHMISHGASHINTSLVVDDADANQSIHLLHDQFFASEGAVQ